MLIVGVIAVMLFGNRLPEVGRSVGRSIMEFKKGMRDIQSQMDVSMHDPSPSQMVRHHRAVEETDEPTAPKFEPPTHEPLESSDHQPGQPRVTV
jgi:sec-independent protein translocase protein TatA